MRRPKRDNEETNRGISTRTTVGMCRVIVMESLPVVPPRMNDYAPRKGHRKRCGFKDLRVVRRLKFRPGLPALQISDCFAEDDWSRASSDGDEFLANLPRGIIEMMGLKKSHPGTRVSYLGSLRGPFLRGAAAMLGARATLARPFTGRSASRSRKKYRQGDSETDYEIPLATRPGPPAGARC